MTDDERRRCNQDTVVEMLAASSAGDPEGQLVHCAEHIVYEMPYYGLDCRRGRDALAAMLSAAEQRFTSVSYTVAAFVDALDPDLVIAEVRGDNPVRGTDRRDQNHCLMLVRFREDKVVHWVEHSNPDEYRRAVVGPSP